MNIADLTHPMTNGMPIYPGTRPPLFEQANTIEKDGFAELFIQMPTHIGTHMDAPCHILKNAKTLSDFSLQKFTGNALKIPCHNFTGMEITQEFLQAYSDEIAASDFVILEAGWDKFWGTPVYYENFPVLSYKAAEWLSRFHLKGIGLDAISIDKVGSENLPNHRLFLEKEILIIENLCNLDQVKQNKFTFQCFPLAIKDADGSPVRAAAFWEEEIQSFFL